MFVLEEETLVTLEKSLPNNYETIEIPDNIEIVMCGSGCIDCSAMCENDCSDTCSGNNENSW